MPDTWAPVPDGSDFPLENLPFGVARIGGTAPRAVVRIGDHVVDLVAAGIAVSLTDQPTLNALMASGRDVRSEVGELLVGGAREEVLHRVEDCEVLQVSPTAQMRETLAVIRRNMPAIQPPSA